MGTPLMVRATNELEARRLPGILALGAFVSPDNRWIGFFTPTELLKVSIAGGPTTSLGPVSGASLGASWRPKCSGSCGSWHVRARSSCA